MRMLLSCLIVQKLVPTSKILSAFLYAQQTFWLLDVQECIYQGYLG